MNGLRVCYSEWSKSERENQISYIDTCMRNLKKSKTAVLMNLFARQEYRCRHKEQTWTGQGAGEGEGGMSWQNSIDMCIPLCVKQRAAGSCCRAQGAQLSSAPWWPNWVERGEEWEGGSREKGHVYAYSWFMLSFVRN